MADNKVLDSLKKIAGILGFSFDGETMQPVIPAAPAAPVVEITLIDVELKDGTMLSVDKMEVGGMATIAGNPAPAADYEAKDGQIIKVGEGGVISEIIPAPVMDPAEVPAVMDAPPAVPYTMEQIQTMSAQFATGTPEERITNIESICRALMESCFGWQLREAQTKAVTDQAIAVYKNGFEAQGTELVTIKEKFAAVQEENKKMKEASTEMLTLLISLAKIPAGDPAEPPKLSFAQEQVESRKDQMKKLAGNMQAFAEKNKNNK